MDPHHDPGKALVLDAVEAAVTVDRVRRAGYIARRVLVPPEGIEPPFSA